MVKRLLAELEDGRTVEITDERLIELVKDHLAKQESNEYEFEFDSASDPRKAYPYVAKLVWEDGKLQRKFYNLEKLYGKKVVRVRGKFKAKNGDVIEMQKGGSWKNKYRYIYVVKDGKLIEVGDAIETKVQAKARDYLQGKIKLEELIG